MREIKIDPKKKDLIKKFSVTKEEKEKFETLQSILTIHNIEMDGIKTLLFQHAVSIRKRLDIKESDAPKGYERFVDFDPITYEVMVIDRPVLQEEKKEVVEKTPEKVVN